jgi:serine/threonine protein kinase
MPESAPPGAIELPATFGKYFLTEKLATGGMAEIYLAKLVGPGGFEKQLVIKQIHPRLSGQRHFVDLFVAEAKMLVTLAHGNIVPVYELGVIDDTYFIAMEYIDGPTLYRLTEVLRRREVTMDPAIAAWITARILEGLDYAHRKGEGAIHRDLSPRNVMLSRDGEVKLVDFGIAVTLGAGGEDETGQAAPTGSFPYMSPEQVRKEALTVQTDLFSVGVLLWEMLVGHRLFARDDPDATLSAVVDGEIVRPSAAQPEVPARLDEVVMRALERDMTARWASAADMLAAIQRYLYNLDDTPGPRDLAALVARYCPPETRRLPTHHDELADAEPVPEATQPRAGTSPAVPEAPRPGPATSVIARPGAAPRGKRRSRARTETFATHVALDEILERASPAEQPGEPGEPDEPDATTPVRGVPIVASDAERDDATPVRTARRAGGAPERDDPTPVRPRAASTPPPLPQAGAPPRPPGSRPESPIQLPGRGPPAAALLLLAGVGAVGLAGGAVYVFYNGRAAVLRPDAPPRPDAHVFYVEPDDAAIDDATPGDAAPGDAAPGDAAPGDARAVPHDAGARPPPRPDARVALDPPIDAAAARPVGSAILTVGANPWGNVLIDGKKIGRTPIEQLSVAAGHHVIEVVFGGEDPPRTLRYTVDLSDGETKDVLADFTKP